MKTENRVRPPLDPFRKADLSAPRSTRLESGLVRPARRDTSVLSKRWAGDGLGDLSAPARRDTSVLSKRWAGDGSGTCRLPRRDTSVLAKRRIDKQPEKPCENPVIKVDKDRLRYYISVPFNKSCWGLQQDGLKLERKRRRDHPSSRDWIEIGGLNIVLENKKK